MSKTIRIGTRDSELALWQANTVKDKLAAMGYRAILVPVKSQGDLVLDRPLYELGITGIFTKTLDIAMLNGDIDIAVHSMKDVPTALPQGMVQGAVLERARTEDVLLHKGLGFLDTKGIIATGSLRRRSQWLHRYPEHAVVDLRGNVNTRLRKLEDNDWNGAIFAAAGLERIALLPKDFLPLHWMVPAPAQGAMVVAVMEKDSFCRQAVAHLNHPETALCTAIEREFLKTLEGGCTAPIGALATIQDNVLHFKGVLLSLDGAQKKEIIKNTTVPITKELGSVYAMELLELGGQEIVDTLKKQ
jgi:hydroxymethylbilane synthase